jgi:hypothetical protein
MQMSTMDELNGEELDKALDALLQLCREHTAQEAAEASTSLRGMNTPSPPTTPPPTEEQWVTADDIDLFLQDAGVVDQPTTTPTVEVTTTHSF